MQSVHIDAHTDYWQICSQLLHWGELKLPNRSKDISSCLYALHAQSQTMKLPCSLSLLMSLKAIREDHHVASSCFLDIFKWKIFPF